MIASILMQHKSRGVNVDNKGVYGNWQGLAFVWQGLAQW
jgi:hypothetical protein